MSRRNDRRLGIRLTAIAALAAGLGLAAAGPATAQTVAIDKDDIGGVVTGPNGPEAGVWVIAESKDFDTRYIKAVVTDDQGRYVLPDLPAANYDIWVRGYGLVDSPRMRSGPGRILNLTAVPAPNAATAAQYYPAIYWYSMLEIPGKDQFGGKGDIPKKIDQHAWLYSMKSNGCIGCHQLGNLATRTIPQEFGTGEEGWMRRVQSGQAGGSMTNLAAGKLAGVPFKYFGDWTDRIAKGELPFAKPQRPRGVERNIVVTIRDWLTPKQYLHDLISTDKRNPTVNGYGLLYGSAEFSTDEIPVLDPKTNKTWSFTAPAMQGTKIATAGHALGKPVMPSAYWGDEVIWKTRTTNHNPMFDEDGRVWFAARVRNPENPDFCKKGSSHPSAKLTPTAKSTRHLSVYDPKTKDYKMVNTCFSTHHLQFDKDGILWTSGGRTVIGWLDAKKFLETGDSAASQGWSAFVVDANGNGKRDEGYVKVKGKIDPAKDKEVKAGIYAVMPSPVDDSVWGTYRSYPGAVVRVVPGANPPATMLTQIYNVPLPGFGPRGGDIDKQGVVWVSLASGHIGAFDVRKCKGPLNGPKAATGDHCPEGWSFYQYPGPGFKGIGENSAESSYYTWVDQHNTLGLGEDVPVSTGNLNDGLIAYDRKSGEMVTLRVPYPMGFYAKGLDGRIDDPNAGWKGRGLWTTSGDRTPWLMEGGKGSKPLVVHFQVRPNPLAK